ncbi:hypothetical protein [Leptothrix discophora]|uniref:Transmembrane protein n=1 Tax=Leptothrix discophora TaxID=89 RepID=A0ABT9G330_LEPDI|nr:hypothetical protein [Leptothrix discophora]MDP4300588.1 hypothetical protein [Leptothrix discophora]
MSAHDLPEPARDISALGWSMTLFGLAVLCGSLVLPERPLLLAPMAALLALVGLGLLRRATWSRGAAMALFAGMILAQLGMRWLESDLFLPIAEALRGVHVLGMGMAPSLQAAVVPTLSLSSAVVGALICLLMAHFFVRLDSAAVRLEFLAAGLTPPQATGPGSPTSPSM